MVYKGRLNSGEVVLTLKISLMRTMKLVSFYFTHDSLQILPQPHYGSALSLDGTNGELNTDKIV